MQALCQAGADPNAHDLLGCSPVHMASDRGHAAVLEMLVRGFGADAGAQDAFNNSGIHYAARGGHGSAVSLTWPLAKRNGWPDVGVQADRMRPDPLGRSAVRFLVENDADPAAVDSGGGRPPERPALRMEQQRSR